MGTYLPGLNFPIYSGWTQYTPVIPKLYWDVYSAEQRMKQLCMNFDKVEHYLDYVAEMMNEWNIEFDKDLNDELAKMWKEVHDGYEYALNNWFTQNAERIFKAMFSNVWFGLTLDGYFVAYIPESWDDIVFDTGMVYGSEEYGRLILLFNVDNANPVDPDIGEYHSDFGILNNNVQQLGSDVQQLDSSIDALSDTVSDFGTDLTNLESRVTYNETTLYSPIQESENGD